MYYNKLYLKNAKYKFCKIKQKIKINIFIKNIKMRITNNYSTQIDTYLAIHVTTPHSLYNI